MKKGILYGIGAYLLWGFFRSTGNGCRPFRIQIISHRIIWSFVLLACSFFITRQWRAFRSAAFSRRCVDLYGFGDPDQHQLADVCLGVNAGFVIETSLAISSIRC